MSQIIEFPRQNQEPQPVDYAGHVLLLDLTKASRWQCFNFWVGANSPSSIVPDNASMDRIHAAVQAGILVDITEKPELWKHKLIADHSTKEVKATNVATVDTGKKTYSGTRKFFRDAGITDEDPAAPEDEQVSYSTGIQEEQALIETALAALRNAPAPRKSGFRPVLVLPPGMDDPDKYTLPFSGQIA